MTLHVSSIGEILVVLKEVILEGFDPRVDLNL